VSAAHGPTSYLLERIYEGIGGCLSDMGDPTAFGWIFDAYETAASRERPPSTNLMRRALTAFDWAAGARDFDAAERYYQRALENSAAIPEEAIRDRLTMSLRNGRVCQLAQRGDAGQAVQVAMPLLAYYNDVYAKLGRLTPAQGAIWICTADALRQLGRFDEAIRIANTFRERCLELIKIAPRANCAPRAATMRALVELDAGRVPDALATMGEQLDGPPDPKDARSPLAHGRLLLAAGRAPEAVEILRNTYGGWLSKQPDSPYAAESLFWFGRAYLAVGDKRGGWMVAQARQKLAASPVASHRRLATGHAVP
jgi:tetratricopeptide (TPR) repeat protein